MGRHKFLTELYVKVAQMMDPNMAPPPGAMPPGPPPPPPGMPPMDPAMMGGGGGMPPMDPSMMGPPPAGGPMGGIDPNMIAALMQQAPPPAEEGEGNVSDKQIADKALDVAESAMQLALARGEDEGGASDAAAGSLLASGALEGISPEEIMGLNQEAMPQEVPPPAPDAEKIAMFLRDLFRQ